ncbi:ComF family protein [Microcella sp.]|uniref:ComF family protein n=1 Tax=Microcella sp. TaxID=1913979 RepID=UPI002562F326|nr:phosphoribosyltransferase family protein [Microcella sp.]MBX9472775.1 ComF family protein [Microcella sp.]
MTLLQAFADAWALVAPVDCAGCGATDRAICPTCALGLRSRPLLGELELHTSTLPVTAALPYDGVARRVLLAFKEEGRTELARPLAGLLSTAVELACRASLADLLVPVPGSWAAAGRRGFDPVALIARRAGLVVTPALRAVRGGAEPQKSRGLADRLAAASSAAPRWRVSPRMRGCRVVLVDDVVTSGATLRAAVLALREAGAEVAGCAAIAATPRRVGTSSIPWRFLSNDDEGPDDNDAREDYREGKEA